MTCLEFSFAVFALSISASFLKGQEVVKFSIKKHSSYVQDAGDLAQIYKVSCGECVNACSLRNTCEFISYRRYSQQCKLFSTDKEQSVVRKPKSVVIARKNIDTSSVPDKCQSCGDDQVCQKTTKECKTETCPTVTLANGRIDGNVRTTGSRLRFTCNDGYSSSVDGARTGSLICLPNGAWKMVPVCLKDCEPPPTMLNTVLVSSGTSHNSNAYFKCNDNGGYYEQNGLTEAEMIGVCDATKGSWSIPDFTCIKDCPSWTRVDNGELTALDGGAPTSKAGVRLKALCNTGFFNIAGGDSYEIFCKGETGSWQQITGVRCVKNCTDPPEVLNADRWTTGNSPDSTTSYSCLYGTKATFRATCSGNDGSWTGVPVCSTEDTCGEYLVNSIPDSFLTASSYFYSEHNDLHAPHHARLTAAQSMDSAGSWVAHSGDELLFIQAKFRTLKHVNSIVTMGRDAFTNEDQFVKSYSVSYSRDCTSFYDVMNQDGDIQIFPGNSDKTTRVTNALPEPVSALCVRIHPLTYENYASLRFDVIGCNDRCTTYLVSGNYGVDDASLTASSYYEKKSMSAKPFRARLDTLGSGTQYGGWGVERKDATGSEYIQVRFRRQESISSVVSQGMNSVKVWVKSYTVSYSRDCLGFNDVVTTDGHTATFKANRDSESKVENTLPVVINALCVRIHPMTYYVHIGMRFDLKGCIENVCPKSAERFITPYISSTLALRIMPGSYTKEEANAACKPYGKLVILDTEDKQNAVVKMMRSCRLFANQVYWVDGTLVLHNGETEIKFSDGTTRSSTLALDATLQSSCLAISAESRWEPPLVYYCEKRIGYICEYNI